MFLCCGVEHRITLMFLFCSIEHRITLMFLLCGIEHRITLMFLFCSIEHRITLMFLLCGTNYWCSQGSCYIEEELAKDKNTGNQNIYSFYCQSKLCHLRLVEWWLWSDDFSFFSPHKGWIRKLEFLFCVQWVVCVCESWCYESSFHGIEAGVYTVYCEYILFVQVH